MYGKVFQVHLDQEQKWQFEDTLRENIKIHSCMVEFSMSILETLIDIAALINLFENN